MYSIQEKVNDLIAEGYSKPEAWRMVRDYLERKKPKANPPPIRDPRENQIQE